MSSRHVIKLTGMVLPPMSEKNFLVKAAPATPQTASNVSYFVDDKHFVTVKIQEDGSILLSTGKGNYKLEKHSTINMWKGVCNGVKVHVTLKKMVGHIIYWK